MERTPILNHKTIGFGSAFLFLHGLLGSGDNWTTFAKRFEAEHQLVFPDLRNHGLSFHSQEMDYSLMAADLVRLLDHLKVERIFLLGHSMGGKTAIQFAHDYPDRIAGLIVVDSTFGTFPGGHEYIMEAIANTDLDQFASRKSIQDHLSATLRDPGLLYFIMKNIRRQESRYSWKVNISGLRQNYPKLLAPLRLNHGISTPTLFCMAENSKYIRPEDRHRLDSTFENYNLKVIAGAGHWVHVDNPDELYTHVSAFVGKINI